MPYLGPIYFAIIILGELEELKETVMCLCRGDYLTALQGKTSQHLLQVTAVTAGEISTIVVPSLIQNNFVLFFSTL